MNKKLTAAAVAGALVFGLFAAAHAASAPAPLMVLKLSSQNNATNPQHYGYVKFAEEVDRLTNGAIKIEIYTDSTLGNEREMVEGCALGTTEIAPINTAMLETFISDYSVLNLPFMFGSQEHATRVVHGEVGDHLSRLAAERLEFNTMWWTYSGYRDLLSNRPIKTVDDLRGLKIRTQANAMQVRIWELLGCIAVPLSPAEQMIALQQGTVDALENATSMFYGQKWYEAAKYVSFTHHNFSFQPVGISTATLSRIPAEYRDALYEAGKIAEKYEHQVLLDENAKAEAELAALGIEFFELPMDRLRAMTEPLHTEYADIINQDLLRKIAE